MSEVQSEKITSELSTVGTVLRSRRESLGWSLEDVAAHLRIRLVILKSLEEGNYNVIPGRAYIIGFVKSYAGLMNLDEDALCQKMNHELRNYVSPQPHTQFTLPKPKDEKSISLRLLLFIGFVVVIMAYAGWYHFSSRVVLPHTPPSVSSSIPASVDVKEHAASHAEQVSSEGNKVLPSLPNTESGQSSASVSASKEGTVKDTPDLPPIETPAPPENALIGTSTSSPFVGPHPVERGEGHALDVGIHSSNPETSSSSPVSSGAPQKSEAVVIVHVLADSWVQVKDLHGRVLVSRVMKKGEDWSASEPVDGYRLTVGNAGGIALQFKDVVSGLLGKNGRVLHDVLVTPNTVESGQYGHGTFVNGQLLENETVPSSR